MSRADLAEWLDVEERTVTNWVKDEPDFPSRVSGRSRTFPLRACSLWYAAYRERVGANRARPADYDEAKTRKLAAEAELAEYELARERGELVTIATAVAEAGRVYDELRARILAARPRLAAAVVGVATIREADQRVGPVIAELLESLSGEWPA